jgi:hypothetical protein
MKLVKQVMGITDDKIVKGDVGLEIEVEGTNLPAAVGGNWRVERDGSLQDGLEYVLNAPTDMKGVVANLRHLQEVWKVHGTKINNAVRAGVHVHINCQELTVVQLYNFFTLFLCLENVLTKWCGPTREGNLFCLRSKDAEWLINQICAAANSKEFKKTFRSDNLRYSAMNVKALGDYGSLEFRAMRSNGDLELVRKWAECLLGLRKLAEEFDDPQQVIMLFSRLGPQGFAQEILGPFYDEVWNLYRTEGEMEDDLHDGMRQAQDVAYAKEDWAKLFPKTRLVGQLEFPVDVIFPNEPHEDF